ncbi:MAG: glutamine--fructose-6-phosphate transaminase (isomerizing) [Anaerolineae bacterium]|nr:glutamine--fructose-6-phosphate transaminase (isomerizing) [Anaerolineae bacterium]
MCGIVGYIGDKDATPIILEGLKKLEYRGYDSAGIAVLKDGKIDIRRDSGKISHLEALVEANPLKGSPGIGHTRWATHGEPNERNSHPHVGYKGQVVIVHNGIVENYLELRDELISEGIQFNSDTDTETIVHMIEIYLEQEMDLEEAVRSTLKRIKGAHGIVVLSTKEPEKIISARIGNAGGVVIGLGEGENYIASDIPAILEHTNRMVFLDSHQMAVLQKDKLVLKTLDGKPLDHKVETINLDPVSAVKGNYRHFMQKEIHEQVRSLTETLAGRIDFNHHSIVIPTLNIDKIDFEKLKGIKIIACGTAGHAGQVGKFMIENIAKIPVEVDIASEFRYRDPLVDENQIVLAISQSGETADTLAAMEEGRKKGAHIWSIVNAIGSQAMRLAEGFISMQAGPEIGVASTKAFTAPLVDLYLLAVLLADKKGLLSDGEIWEHIVEISKIPDLVGTCLDREDQVRAIAGKYKDTEHMLYLGRGINMPIAYEGALKLKEISYIHAEAYPAGEMKHGPIALIDKAMPVLAVMPKDKWYEKMLSQVEQAKARGGKVIIVATDGDEQAANLADDVLWIPSAGWMVNPILAVIPLQILAYHIAAMRGLDVDQPRNLAKSVTVE